MGAIAKKGWEQYMLQLQLHPLRTKAITAGVLAGISDSVAQKLSGFQRIQWNRLLLKVIFGFAYGGPFGHFLHKLLDIIFKGRKDKKTVAQKVLLEQASQAPTWFSSYLLILLRASDVSITDALIRDASITLLEQGKTMAASQE